MSFKNEAPDCTCQDGYYLNSTNFECEKCPNRFSSCENPGRGTCKLPDRITEKCVCQEGFYHVSDQQACLPCEYPCKTCMSQTYCLECVDSLNRNLQDCSCKSGYYTNQENECKLCVGENCKQCNQNGICEECLNDNLIPPFCYQEKSGFFIEIQKGTNSQKILQCSNRCETCENSMENCTTCKNIEQFRQNSPPCLCLEGYHDNSGQEQYCSKCAFGCKLCVNDEQCLECEKNINRTLNSYTSKCECEKGYREDPKTKECSRCYLYLQNCYLLCPQSTQADDKEFVCIERNYMIKNNVVLILFSGVFLILIVIITQSLVYRLTHASKKEINTNNKQTNIE